VKAAAKCPIDLDREAATWPQMLPLAKDPHGPQVGDKTPVLFELAGEDSLAPLVGEILRLGNDRQSYRWLSDGDHATALLRVVGPPYYSLLRALDREGEPGAPVAYREAASRVWTQLGWTHPLAEHLRPPPGELLLCRPPNDWHYVPEAKYHDIYDVIDFALPHTPRTWSDAKWERRITVPLRLARGGSVEGAELWLLRGDGIAQLEDLVRHADDHLLGRLAFAVANHDRERLVVVRTRPSKLAPPVLVLDGLALRPYLRLPNLFLPVGARLHPPLRRDTVVKLLANDSAKVVWLMPHDDGSFTPESIPDDAFRPLSQWIDYLFDHEAKALTTWTRSMTFDFEAFVCHERGEEKEKPKPPPKPSKKAKPTPANEENAEASEERGRVRRNRKVDPFVDLAASPPSELETRLRECERQFQEMTTPLDDPQRQELWREMARLGGALGQQGDAAICWSHGLWEEARLSPDWGLAWYRQETKPPTDPPSSVADFLKRHTADPPTHATLRRFAAYLLWAVSTEQPPADLRTHVQKLQQHLERHEHFLGVRSTWLAWHALHRLSGGDVLTLARARDRLLERLHLHGLAVDLDLPLFLRTRGDSASQRFRQIREHAVRLHRLVLEWAKTGPSLDHRALTPAYIDLIFAYGMARLGDTAECHRLLGLADDVLANRDDVHAWLHEAYRFRVLRALEGRPGAERLPDELLARLESNENPDYLQHMEKDEREKAKDQLRLERYKIDRLRAASRIIEPHEKVEPYRRWHGRFADELSQTLATLADVNNRDELAEKLQKLLSPKQKFKGAANPEARILLSAMELAPRLGEAFAGGLLDRVPAVLAGNKDPVVRALVLEKGLFLAAHFDRAGDVQVFVDHFDELLEPGAKDTPPVENLVGLLSQSVRGLRKLGRREEVGALLDRMELLLRSDPTLQDPKALANARGKSLALLLKLAEGKFFFGQEEQARAILDQTRETLLRRDLLASSAASVSAVPQKEVACAYLSALGQAPMDLALARVMELFRRLEGIGDSFTTTTHYSLSRLEVVEAVVLALASDDFAMDRDARRWLDDDEFLVRRRIHRDVREAMG
jgi:hypothetical protein